MFMVFVTNSQVEACGYANCSHIIGTEASIESSFNEFTIEVIWELPYGTPRLYVIDAYGVVFDIDHASIPNEIRLRAMEFLANLTPPPTPRAICCNVWRTGTRETFITNTDCIIGGIFLNPSCFVRVYSVRNIAGWLCVDPFQWGQVGAARFYGQHRQCGRGWVHLPNWR